MAYSNNMSELKVGQVQDFAANLEIELAELQEERNNLDSSKKDLQM